MDANANDSLTVRYPLPMDLYGRFTPNFLLFSTERHPGVVRARLLRQHLERRGVAQPGGAQEQLVRRVPGCPVHLGPGLPAAAHLPGAQGGVERVPAKRVPRASVLPVLLLTAQYLSPLLVLGFTVERWLSVCFPFRRESLCTTGRAGAVVGCMTAGALLWNLWQLYFKDGCEVHGDGWGWPVYTLVTEVLISGLVPGSALVFNLLVVRRDSTHRRQQRRRQEDGDHTRRHWRRPRARQQLRAEVPSDHSNSAVRVVLRHPHHPARRSRLRAPDGGGVRQSQPD